MDASVKQKRRWLIEFALASLVPIVVVGLFLGEAIHSQAKTRATAMARQEAQMVGDVAFRRVLGPGTDLTRGLSGQQLVDLDSALESARQGADVTHATLRDRAGTVVYSDDHLLLGKVSAQTETRSAINGETVSKITDASDDPANPGVHVGRVLQVWLPMRLASPTAPPTGALELWIPYSAVEHQVASQSNTLMAM